MNKQLKIIGLYSRERSPAGLTLLIAALLLTSVMKELPHPTIALIAILIAALMLFLIRLSDDLCDVDIDRIAHPERLLCRDQFSVKILQRFRWLASGLLILISVLIAVNLVAMLIFLSAVLLICGLFFS